MSARSNVVRLIERNPVPTDLHERTERLRATVSRLHRLPITEQGNGPDHQAQRTDFARSVEALERTILNPTGRPQTARREPTDLAAASEHVADHDEETIMGRHEQFATGTPIAERPPEWDRALGDFQKDRGAAQADPVFKIIEAHRAAWTAFGDAVTASEDPLPEMAAETERQWQVANRADYEAWADVVEARPCTHEGLRAWLGYIDETRERYDAVSADYDYFGAVREVTQALLDETAIIPFARTSRDMPTDWSDPPEGFMSFPALHPSHFIAVELGLPKEALRLLRIATAEWDRLYPHRLHDEDLLRRTRRDLRLDELKAAAYGQEAIDAQGGPPAEGEVSAQENAIGFVQEGDEVRYRDAAGTLHRTTVSHWIGFTLQRLAAIAMRETTRRENAIAWERPSEDEKVAAQAVIRRELMTDELKALAFGARRRGTDPDPILAAIREHDAARVAVVDLDDGVDKDAYRNGHDARITGLDAVHAVRPTTVAGLFALAEHLRQVLEEDGEPAGLDGTAGDHALAALLEGFRALSGQPKLPVAVDGEAAELADAIEREWAGELVEAAAHADELGPEGDERIERLLDRRYAIIDRVEALSGDTREARHAKALAVAWMNESEIGPGRPRTDFERDIRLVFDIQAALTDADRV